MLGLNGLLSGVVSPQRKADSDFNKPDSRERPIDMDIDALRMSGPRGQL